MPTFTNWRGCKRGLLLGAVLAGVVGLCACEVVNSRSGLQCQSTSDCRARGGAFALSICSSKGTCELINAPDAAVSTGCETSGQCAFQLGAPARCINGACVALTTPACTSIGPTSDDGAVLFGVFVPSTGAAGAATATLKPSLETLLAQWNAVAADPPPPQFAGVLCDEGQLATALPFLAQLQPGFVVGPFTEAALQALQAQAPYPVFSPMGDSAIYATSPQPNHPWFCNSSRGIMVAPFQDAVQKIASKVAADRAEANVKLDFIENSAEPNEKLFFDTVKTNLTFNGKLASTQPNFYLEQDVNFDTLTDGNTISLAYQTTTARPDVIVFTSSLWAGNYISQLESRWAVLNPSVPRPVYLMVRQNIAFSSFAVSTQAQSDWDNRVYAIDIHRDATEQANLNSYVAVVAQNELGGLPEGGSNYSDCMFSAFYGLTQAAQHNATAPTSVTPFQLGQGVQFVTGGTTQGNLTTTDFSKLLGLINGNVQTELVGTSGYYGFNSTTGIASSALDIYCLGSQAGASPEQWTFAGVEYDATTQAPSGSLVCP